MSAWRRVSDLDDSLASMSAPDVDVRTFGSAADWSAWLDAEHATSRGCWLKISRKGSMHPTVSYAEALEVALCFGWIDGQKRPLDEDHWLQRFTPRRPGSRWSKINAAKADALEAAGRMRPAGQREVDAARADGRWDGAYEGQRASTVPDDLRQALDANPAAAAFFGSISSVNRYAIVYRIGTVKRPETRARKIAQYVQMLAERKTIHPDPAAGQ
jgi:uncharacterized protein YdeI (YjbR/CyaY-like superfamily)